MFPVWFWAGLWGLIAFLWFAVSSLAVLYKNYRFTPPELRTVNGFLFAYFLMRLLYFLLLYGHFADELYVFTGAVALSISINGGVQKPSAVMPQPAVPQAGSRTVSFFFGSTIDTIKSMMCRGVRNCPASPCEPSTDSKYSKASPRETPSAARWM